MASNWLRQTTNNYENKRNPILLAFIIFQAFLILIIVIAVIYLNSKNAPEDDATYYKNTPELAIKNLKEKMPTLEKTEVESIQKKLFEIASENTGAISKNKIEASLREDTIHTHSFDENTKYLSAIVDIPSLKQSYEIYYSSNAVLDPEVSTFVLCLENEADLTYKNFNCKSSDNKTIRDKIAPAYLGFFHYEYFSTYIDEKNNPSTIIISPSVTFENSEQTKAQYINETKESVKSLGLSPDKYQYYVRTAADVNYNNNWR